MSFTLQHIVRQPLTPSSQPPVLVLLHGVGSNEHDLMGLADALDPRFLVISARAPITLGPGSYGWYHVEFTANGLFIDEAEAEDARVLLLRFLREALAAYPVDPARVYLLGFSQGCAMTLAVALTAPEILAGAVGMSGRLPPGIENKLSPAVDELPMLIVHGTADTVLPLRYGQEIRDFLTRISTHVTYQEFPMGHHVTTESLDLVARWLSQKLG